MRARLACAVLWFCVFPFASLAATSLSPSVSPVTPSAEMTSRSLAPAMPRPEAAPPTLWATPSAPAAQFAPPPPAAYIRRPNNAAERVAHELAVIRGTQIPPLQAPQPIQGRIFRGFLTLLLILAMLKGIRGNGTGCCRM